MENKERPVFDVANDNAIRTDFEVPTAIPSEKEAARRLLAGLGVGGGVSITMACANANLPIERGWRSPPPDSRVPNPWKPRKPAANDNEPQDWPLLEALRRDGRDDDIPWVRRYRLLCEVVSACPFHVNVGGGDEEGVSVEARSLRLSGENFDKPFASAARKGWEGTKLAGGDISYRETRRTVKQRLSVGQRASAVSDETGEDRRLTSLCLHMAEGDRLAQIDGRVILAEINEQLGWWDTASLEDAVLGAKTLTWIGATMRFHHKAAPREGKVAVYMAIDHLKEVWRKIEKREAWKMERCEARALARGHEIVQEKASYLGLAA
ncbi:hypothetical protein [Mesorhizobium sp. M1365]|uniref:hypothetical protein n=1 Tax=Mesorhizobium sp. M1365 TaxID=2957090 RepID=UPI0033383E54